MHFDFDGISDFRSGHENVNSGNYFHDDDDKHEKWKLGEEQKKFPD